MSRTPPVAEQWMAQWPKALATWSSFTQLRPPRFLAGREARAEGMERELACIRLVDQSILVNADTVGARHLENDALAVMAHEIGHHIYVPGNLTDNARMQAAMARMLQGLPNSVVLLAANLYGDLLINDRLQRRAGVDIAGVYRRLCPPVPTESAAWRVYMRTYEHLWRLPAGTLAPPGVTEAMEADALLLSRIIRSFAGDWLKGARRFASVMFRHLAEDEERHAPLPFQASGLHDTRAAGANSPGESGGAVVPDGLTEIDASELEDDGDFEGDLLDPFGEREASLPKPLNTVPRRESKGSSENQYRPPFQYEQLLKSLGLNLDAHEVTRRYYRERALPHLLPFPTRRSPAASEPLREGEQDWQPGDALEALDLFASVSHSPVVVPGITTVQPVFGEVTGSDPARIPMDLDVYVDCSGSMPNPAVDVSYLALAGTILALSALRAGAKVQATLWSGPGQFETTGGFIREEKRVLGIITGYISGATAFPLHVLRDTYASRKPTEPPAHVVVISDEGVDTLLQNDEKGVAGERVCRAALDKARGGGTLVLNLGKWRLDASKALEEIGFRIHRVNAWEDLVAFAREFVRQTYGEAP